MARITPIKVNQIILYLYAQGYKAGNARKLGPDIVEYLIGAGHTMNSSVEKKLRTMPSAGWSSQMSDWTSNAPIIPAMFGGLSAYQLDEYYTRRLPNSGGIELNPTGAPSGRLGGGKGSAAKFGNYNTTGWDTTNLDSIANDGKLNSEYVSRLQNLRAGSPFRTEFAPVGFTGYTLGSALSRYSSTVPTPSGATVVAPSSTPTPTPSPITEEEEEEVIEAIEEVAGSIVADLDKFTEKTDWSIFIKDGETFTPATKGERKVSTKSYLASNGIFDITSGKVVVTMPVLSPELGGLDIYTSIPAFGSLPDETLYSNLLTIQDPDDEDEELFYIAPPTVHFVLDADTQQVSIVINGEQVPAVKDEAGLPYSFNKLQIVVDDPSRSSKIIDVLLDGNALITGKTVQNELGKFNQYGFPVAGVQGLPVDCYADNYDKEAAVGDSPDEKALKATWRYIDEGGRDVRFGISPQSIDYNLDMLSEAVLQPLALDFDTELDLTTQSIYFNLLLSSVMNSSNLFPGFDINSGLSEAEGIILPDDVRNLRPMTEDNKVMLQKFSGRKAGMGIKQIRIASSNLQGPADISIGGKTYNAEVYTQVEVTFEDDAVLLIPDSDEGFKALDNSNSELTGTVSVSETTEKPQIFLLSPPTDIQQIYEAIEKTRRSARLSDKNNRKDADNKIITQTAMIQQDNSYYIIMGVGDNTVVVELNMGKEE